VSHALAGCVTATVVTDESHSDHWHSQSFKSLRKRQAAADAQAVDAHGASLRAEANASGQTLGLAAFWA
jgi:hypothetical protein